MRIVCDTSPYLILSYPTIIDNRVFSARYLPRFPQFNSGGKGVFESAGTVSIPLPLACNKVLVAVAIDDTTDIEAGTIGWVTSQTNNNMISFGCAKQISVFVYLAICI